MVESDLSNAINQVSVNGLFAQHHKKLFIYSTGNNTKLGRYVIPVN